MSRIGDFVTRMGTKYGMPSQEGGFGVALTGRREAVVTGCRRILHYGEDEMILALVKGKLRVRGSGLFCYSFEGGAVTLRGLIDAVLFEGDA